MRQAVARSKTSRTRTWLQEMQEGRLGGRVKDKKQPRLMNKVMARFSVRAQWGLEGCTETVGAWTLSCQQVPSEQRPTPDSKGGTQCRRDGGNDGKRFLLAIFGWKSLFGSSLVEICSPTSNFFPSKRGWTQRKSLNSPPISVLQSGSKG